MLAVQYSRVWLTLWDQRWSSCQISFCRVSCNTFNWTSTSLNLCWSILNCEMHLIISSPHSCTSLHRRLLELHRLLWKWCDNSNRHTGAKLWQSNEIFAGIRWNTECHPANKQLQTKLLHKYIQSRLSKHWHHTDVETFIEGSKNIYRLNQYCIRRSLKR